MVPGDRDSASIWQQIFLSFFRDLHLTRFAAADAHRVDRNEKFVVAPVVSRPAVVVLSPAPKRQHVMDELREGRTGTKRRKRHALLYELHPALTASQATNVDTFDQQAVCVLALRSVRVACYEPATTQSTSVIPLYFAAHNR